MPEGMIDYWSQGWNFVFIMWWLIICVDVVTIAALMKGMPMGIA